MAFSLETVTAPGLINMQAVRASATELVAVGLIGTIWRSTDGVSWTAQTSGTGADLFSVAYASGRWIAVGDAGVLTYSTDGGVTWTAITVDASIDFRDVTYGSGVWLLLGSNSQDVYRSIDGITWNGPFIPTPGFVTYASVWTGAGFLLSADNGTFITQRSVTGADGTWTQTTVDGTVRSTELGANGTGVVYACTNPNLFGLRRSDNYGVTWAPLETLAESYTVRAIYNDGDFWALFGSSTSLVLYTEDDGASWTTASNPSGQPLYSACKFGAKVYVVGAEGTILSSNATLSVPELTSGVRYAPKIVGGLAAPYCASAAEMYAPAIVELAVPLRSGTSTNYTPKVGNSTARLSGIYVEVASNQDMAVTAYGARLSGTYVEVASDQAASGTAYGVRLTGMLVDVVSTNSVPRRRLVQVSVT